MQLSDWRIVLYSSLRRLYHINTQRLLPRWKPMTGHFHFPLWDAGCAHHQIVVTHSNLNLQPPLQMWRVSGFIALTELQISVSQYWSLHICLPVCFHVSAVYQITADCSVLVVTWLRLLSTTPVSHCFRLVLFTVRADSAKTKECEGCVVQPFFHGGNMNQKNKCANDMKA